VRAIAVLSKRSGARQARHATHGCSVLAQYILERPIASTGPALPRALDRQRGHTGKSGVAPCPALCCAHLARACKEDPHGLLVRGQLDLDTEPGWWESVAQTGANLRATFARFERERLEADMRRLSAILTSYNDQQYDREVKRVGERDWRWDLQMAMVETERLLALAAREAEREEDEDQGPAAHTGAAHAPDTRQDTRAAHWERRCAGDWQGLEGEDE
jgi:hypothetical protein